MRQLYSIVKKLDYTLAEEDVKRIANEYAEKIEQGIYDFSTYTSDIFTQGNKKGRYIILTRCQ